MTAPFASQSFVTKPFDHAKALWPGNSYDVFPLLIALEDVQRQPAEASDHPAMLIDIPHSNNILD
jgi:hypothetical protein